MSARTNNFKLGLFALFGLGLIVASVLAFGAWTHFEKKSLFETYVAGDVNGLSVGSAVELRGLRVGRVTRMGFSWNEYQDIQPGWVVVVFEMRDDAFPASLNNGTNGLLQTAIGRGLRARLKAQGVTGTCILSLEYLNPAEYPPAKVPWTPRHTYIPSAPGLLTDLLVSLQKAMHQLEHLNFDRLTQMLEADLQSAGRLLARVERVDLEGLGTNANALLVDFRGSSTKLDTLLANADGTLKQLPLEKLTRDADALLGQLRDTVAKLEPGVTSVDFDSVNQILAAARHTIQNLDDLMSDLKQYPSGFIFGQPPPRLKEVRPPNK
jgi:ABC-type transporter Mla subunit MlaD